LPVLRGPRPLHAAPPLVCHIPNASRSCKKHAVCTSFPTQTSHGRLDERPTHRIYFMYRSKVVARDQYTPRGRSEPGDGASPASGVVRKPPSGSAVGVRRAATRDERHASSVAGSRRRQPSVTTGQGIERSPTYRYCLRSVPVRVGGLRVLAPRDGPPSRVVPGATESIVGPPRAGARGGLFVGLVRS